MSLSRKSRNVTLNRSDSLIILNEILKNTPSNSSRHIHHRSLFYPIEYQMQSKITRSCTRINVYVENSADDLTQKRIRNRENITTVARHNNHRFPRNDSKQRDSLTINQIQTNCYKPFLRYRI